MISYLNYFIYFPIYWLAIFILGSLPGLLILKKTNISLSFFEKITLGTGLGITFSTLIIFIFRYLGLDIITYLLPLIYLLILLYCYKQKSVKFAFSVKLTREKIILGIILLLGVICQTNNIIRSGFLSENGDIYFQEYRDAFWHISLTRELSLKVPPVHPGFAGETVTNYHYFTHLFTASVYSLTHIPLFILYYQLFPIFYSLFLGLSLYVLGIRLFKNKIFPLFLVTLSYCGSSFAYLLPLWHGPNTYWHESSFWISQTFSMLVNPSVSLSLSLFILTVFILELFWQKNNQKLLIPAAILSGTLISFKVYAGLLVLGALLVLGLFDIFRKNYQTLKLFLISLFISLTIFLPVSQSGSSSFLVFAPGWFLRSMVESPDRVYEISWLFAEETYDFEKNYFGVFRIQFKELLLFLTGNLGVSSISFFTIFLILIKKIKINKTLTYLLLVGTAGFTLPLLFIQKGSIANTIQFAYYSLICGNILTVLGLSYLLSRKKILTVIILTIIFLVSIPTSVSVFQKNFTNPDKLIISKDEYRALTYLKNNTTTIDIILLPLTKQNLDYMYVSTLSERKTYYSDRLMAENTLKKFKDREEKTQKFFQTKDYDWSRSFLRDNNIKYIYLKKGEKTNWHPEQLSLEKILDNKVAEIYSLNL